MRRSPLSHPLAVLRTTIGLTQKELGDLVNRAARTIQSIELNKMPLTEALALRIAEATGADEGWLFAGDPNTPPRKGLTLLQAGRGQGVYTKDDYEYHRAYLELPLATKEQSDAAFREAQKKGAGKSGLPDLVIQKSSARINQMAIIDLIDRDLTAQLQYLLSQTKLSDDMRVVRWKCRRFLEDLAREFSLELFPTGVSVKSLELINPKPPASVKVPKPVHRQERKPKT